VFFFSGSCNTFKLTCNALMVCFPDQDFVLEVIQAYFNFGIMKKSKSME